MVKFTSSLLIAAFAAHVIAAPIQFDTRELQANPARLRRDAAMDFSTTSPASTRDTELDTREPSTTEDRLKKGEQQVKKIAHAANKDIASAAITANNVATITTSIQRVVSSIKSLREDLDDIDTREPKMTLTREFDARGLDELN